jgi:DNA gyrase subunit A
VSEYRKTSRGAKGVQTIKFSEKRGGLAAALVVRPHQELLFISQEGMVQRTGVRGIRQTGRAAQGVTLMNVREEDRVSAVALVVESEAPTSAVVAENGSGVDGATPGALADDGPEVDGASPAALADDDLEADDALAADDAFPADDPDADDALAADDASPADAPDADDASPDGTSPNGD